MKYRKTSEELRKLVGVESIITVIRRGRMRLYGHGMRKNDEDYVKNVWRSELKIEDWLEDQERYEEKGSPTLSKNGL